MLRLAAFLSLLVARVALAEPIFMDSGDAPDCATYTTASAGCDSLLWGTETDVSGTSEDTDITLVKQASSTEQTHNDTNGADGSSKFAFRLDFQTGEARYLTDIWGTFALTNTLTVNFRLYMPASGVPSSNAKEIWRIRESDSTDGCGVRVTSSGTLELRYDATLLGTTSIAQQPTACWLSSDKTSLIGCTTSTDCPPTYACNAVTAGTGQGAFWPGWSMTQENISLGSGGSAGRVRCTLSQAGRALISVDVAQAAKPAQIDPSKTRFGNIVASTGTMTAYVDDIEFDSSNVAQHGYVGVSHVNAGVTGNWSRSNCGGGTTCVGDPATTVHWGCVNELSCQAYNASNTDNLNTGNASNRVEQVRFGALSSGTVPIAGVDAVLLGAASSNAAGTRRIAQRLMLCESTTACVSPKFSATQNITVADSTVDRALAHTFATTIPGGSAGWSSTSVGRVGVEVSTQSTNANQTNWAASLLQAWYVRPPTALRTQIREGNLGTDDDHRCIACMGHSNMLGTTGGFCVNGTEPDGTQCVQLDYASWDPAERDSPTGGCLGSHTAVRTCTQRRTEANGTAGYPCGTCTCASGTSCTGGSITTGCPNGGTCSKVCAGGTNDGTACSTDGDCTGGGVCLGTCSTAAQECPNSGATCVGDGTANDGSKEGTCDKNPNIRCDSNPGGGDPDCNFLGDTCDTTALCISSCGTGGICQGGAGIADELAKRVVVDTLLLCGAGAEGSRTLLDSRWDLVQKGVGDSCAAIIGAGVCQCSSSGQCPGGGTCNGSGLCVGGNACYGPQTSTLECGTCTVDSDCGANGVCFQIRDERHCACQFDKPDLNIVHSGAADVVVPGFAPNCNESTAAGAITSGVCGAEGCPVTTASDLCLTDAEAQSSTRTPPDGSPTARCVGAGALPGSLPCTDSGGAGGRCNAEITPCMTSVDCPVFNGHAQTCSTNNTDYDTIPNGWCTCSADNQCNPGSAFFGIPSFACNNGVCRAECGRCSGNQDLLCSTTADCTAAGAGTCGTPTDNVCRGGGFCKTNGKCSNDAKTSCSTDAQCNASGNTLNACATSSPYICKGRATCPCDRTACPNGDSDCPVETRQNLHGRAFTFRGKCGGGGRCEQCGTLHGGCAAAASTYPNALRNWTTNLHGHRATIEDFGAMLAKVNAQTETDQRQTTIFLNEPQHGGTGCVTYTDNEYLGSMAADMLRDPSLPHVLDTREAVAKYPIQEMIYETAVKYATGVGGKFEAPVGVHYLSPGQNPWPGRLTGQEVVTQLIADGIDSLNHCTTGRCRDTDGFGGPTSGKECGLDSECDAGQYCELKKGPMAPKKYCRSVNRDFTSTVCTSDAGCTAPARCEIRPCTCVCSKNSECRNWYSDSYSCLDGSNGTCDAGELCTCKKTSDNSTACAMFGSFTCDTASAKCVDGSSNDACPAAGDACSPQ